MRNKETTAIFFKVDKIGVEFCFVFITGFIKSHANCILAFQRKTLGIYRDKSPYHRQSRRFADVVEDAKTRINPDFDFGLFLLEGRIRKIRGMIKGLFGVSR
jgi:hypothetical protein